MKLILSLFILTILSAKICAQDKLSVFRDSADLAFDVSDFLISKKGLLPVPMLITEPSVGYGGAMALLYFHDSYENKKRPPSITGGFGGYTENGTWMAGALHAGFWNEDKIRYLGVIGKINVNIDYYGRLPKPVEMNMNTWIILQQIQFRLAETNFFSGLKYTLAPITNTFKLPIDIPEFSGIEIETSVSELSAMFIYDSRNNVISPTNGIWAQVLGIYSDTWMGGEDLYGKINSSFIGIKDVNRKLVIGGKLVANSKLGDVPFYTRPFVQLRSAIFKVSR
ncbi:hypothetical protein [Carboxylicivirga marina]|uniref:Uncharacterized protein n=1 Tax=Carboxylicivirga marina TaxID=2800988 RepID=A0ABS1HJL3_9BACT|nr:hypothetical protein [Carboxylicivirga marina]MBK3517790.1 hypothetical protein [Carboxylicivirga marina]